MIPGPRDWRLPFLLLACLSISLQAQQGTGEAPHGYSRFRAALVGWAGLLNFA